MGAMGDPTVGALSPCGNRRGCKSSHVEPNQTVSASGCPLGMSQLVLLALMLLILVGCATDPGHGARLQYRLPATEVGLALGVDVVGCKNGQASFDTSLSISANAKAGDVVYYVDGRDLQSAVTKRSLTIDVDDNQVITSVNSITTDQKAAIAGGVVKIAAGVAGVAFGAKGGVVRALACSPTTAEQLVTLESLKKTISSLQGKLPTSSDPANLQKQIDALATQVAGIKSALHKDLIAKLKMTTASGVEVAQFDYKPLEGLLVATTNGDPPTVAELDEAFSVHVEYGLDELYAPSSHAKPNNKFVNGLHGASGGSVESCDVHMTVPSVQYISVAPSAMGLAFKKNLNDPPKRLPAKTIPAAQFDDTAWICLSAATGESRTISMKFDKFGQTTELSWAADAQAGNIASAISGATSDASALYKSASGRKLADEKDELDQLQTSQNLRKARICQAALDAGASTCAGN
jgi:hypothetical protein